MNGPVGPEQLEAPHMTTKRACGLMVLPMNIVGDCATECHVLSSRQNRQRKAIWHCDSRKLANRNSRLRAKCAFGTIEMEDAPQTGHPHKRPLGVEAAVSIRTT